jgi:uncharacterized protein YhjY with autotransporter beta-barrel domain
MTRKEYVTRMLRLDPERCTVTSKQDGAWVYFTATVQFEATETIGKIRIPSVVQASSTEADFNNRTLTIRGYYQA